MLVFTVPTDRSLLQGHRARCVRNVICGQRGVNEVAESLLFETVKRSYDHSPKLFARTFGHARKVVIDGDETAAFPIDLPRHRAVIKAIAHAIYYHDTGKRHEGSFGVFSLRMRHRNEHAEPAWDEFRQLLESGDFKPMRVPEPRVFKYGVLESNPGELIYRFEFYEGFVVHAWMRPFKLTPLLYLPIGSRWICAEESSY